MGHRDPWCRRRCPGDLEELPGDHRLDHRTSAGRRRSAAAKSESGWTPALPAGPPLGCVLSAGPLSQDRQRLRGARPAARPQHPQRQLCGRPVGGSEPQGHTQAPLLGERKLGLSHWTQPSASEEQPVQRCFPPGPLARAPGPGPVPSLPAGPPAGGKTVSLTVHGGDVCPCPDLL